MGLEENFTRNENLPTDPQITLNNIILHCIGLECFFYLFSSKVSMNLFHCWLEKGFFVNNPVCKIVIVLKVHITASFLNLTYNTNRTSYTFLSYTWVMTSGILYWHKKEHAVR